MGNSHYRVIFGQMRAADTGAGLCRSEVLQLQTHRFELENGCLWKIRLDNRPEG